MMNLQTVKPKSISTYVHVEQVLKIPVQQKVLVEQKLQQRIQPPYYSNGYPFRPELSVKPANRTF